ncbi:MAG: glucose-1-phosphate adenylyltransferase [Synergistaceae bacterium]|nr:glucose-1-phosphate adenylyltransferase [Synergistaceae bacterium]
MKKECIAMIFADGREAGLGALTDCLAKSAVFYGGSRRIMDFTLDNCRRSGIDAIGILTQDSSGGLYSCIGGDREWSSPVWGRNLFMLSPAEKAGEYGSAADALFRNTGFMEQFDPEYVCVLSGEHIYRMDYARMLDAHKKTGGDMTIAVLPAPFSEARRREILDVDEDGAILGFRETPGGTRNNLTPMGVYIFNWRALREYLSTAGKYPAARNDFCEDVVPALLNRGKRLGAYRFDGYWRNVRTVEDLWASNMDLVRDPPEFSLQEEGEKIIDSSHQPFYMIKGEGVVRRSILSGLCSVFGKVERSVLSDSVVVEEGAEVTESILMPNVYVGKNAKVHKAIVAPNARLMNDVEIGMEDGADDFVSGCLCTNGVSLIGAWVHVAEGTALQKNSHVDNGLFVSKSSSRRVSVTRAAGAAPALEMTLQGSSSD